VKSLQWISIFGAAAVVSACSNEWTRQSFPETYSDHHYWAGRQALEIGEAEHAPLHLQKAAETGSYDAMKMLGTLYSNGTGVEKNLTQAFKWYKKASEAPDGSQVAITKRVGDMYARGDGTPVNEKKATEYWTKALTYYEGKTDLSDSELRTLASMYARGQGRESNGEKAIALLKERYTSGDSDIARLLGDIYHDGLGIRKDMEQAFYWYNIAKKAGDTARLRRLADMYFNGDGTAQDRQKAEKVYTLYVTQLEERIKDPDVHDSYVRELAHMYAQGNGVEMADGQRAIALLKGMRGRDDGLNERLIGDIYYNGYGLKKADKEQAAQWYIKAVELGDKARLALLARIYMRGESITKDQTLAQKYSHLSLKHLIGLGKDRSPSETRRLANMYAQGQGTRQDISRAIDLLLSQTGRGDGYAERLIADYYYAGTGLPKPDMEKALDWYQKAISEGETVRYERVGNMYRDGEGTDVNLQQAQKYWKLAAQDYIAGGDKRASWQSRALANMYADGRGVAQDKAKALSIYKSTALQGDSYAARYGGDLAFDMENMTEARSLYELAAEGGDYVRAKRLADMYTNGLGGPKDPQRAQKLYATYKETLRDKAEEDSPYAALRLARMLISGKGGKTDIPRALDLLKEVAKDIPIAAIEIGDLYYMGEQKPRDYAMAAKWYEKSVAAGETSRLARLAYMYERGQGVSVDKAKANMLFKKAGGR